jgi:hypothetical protein
MGYSRANQRAGAPAGSRRLMETNMRLLLGMIIGAALTIGAAYVHDTKVRGPLAEQQRLVNWEVADALARNTYDGIRAQIREWTGY